MRFTTTELNAIQDIEDAYRNMRQANEYIERFIALDPTSLDDLFEADTYLARSRMAMAESYMHMARRAKPFISEETNAQIAALMLAYATMKEFTEESILEQTNRRFFWTSLEDFQF
jgi:hypothetical protein